MYKRQVSVGARSTGSTVGGIAGLNNNTITGCEVKYIKLQVSGISNITTTQTADEKLASASHVGGIAGRNNDEMCIRDSNDPVAWPTIPELGEKIELTSLSLIHI